MFFGAPKNKNKKIKKLLAAIKSNSDELLSDEYVKKK
jgi:hypothetical protein